MLRTSFVAVAFCAFASPFASAQLSDAGSNRWTDTARNGGGLQQGDATTLTWGFVADGTDIDDFGVNVNSDLIAFLDQNVGNAAVNASTSVLAEKDWFQYFERYHERYAGISGLQYEYVSYDDGARLDGYYYPSTGLSVSPGQIGVRPDVRIGGTYVDGQSGSNTLAYNYYPNTGDMVIDTSNSNFFGDASNEYRGLRNVLAHEHAHGIGQGHYFADGFIGGDPPSFGANHLGLLEPFINLSYDGPQVVDILQTQRGYGDVLEKNGGNDSAFAANVKSLGTLTVIDDAFQLGMDAAKTVVAATDVDFFSIDGLLDTDFYRFALDAAGTLNLFLEPLGLTVALDDQLADGEREGFPEIVDLSSQSDLQLSLYGADGSTLLEFVDANGLGGSESIMRFLEAGDYYLSVSSTGNDAAQFYGLTGSLDAPSAVPEPGSVVLLLIGGAGAFAVKRRRRGSDAETSVAA